jgi:hypothetical protein
MGEWSDTGSSVYDTRWKSTDQRQTATLVSWPIWALLCPLTQAARTSRLSVTAFRHSRRKPRMDTRILRQHPFALRSARLVLARFMRALPLGLQTDDNRFRFDRSEPPIGKQLPRARIMHARMAKPLGPSKKEDGRNTYAAWFDTR